jgi:hypothetical protein
MSAPEGVRMELLVRRLILLAGEVRDQLAAAEWECASEMQAEYDEAFAMFRHLVDGGAALAPALMRDVQRLAEVHAENEQLTIQLRDTAGTERGKVRTLSRMAAYAPLTRNEPGFQSRFVDGSA